ncbi:hypothetical protein [Halalkalibacter urbisdiaboli]|uniref:hypothetical protein n=1 Tax=Halalkalibacter urbisdiaboli TaxID=1960589 RepID=UPI000B4455F3|nr:hypothetical protein [Halalkalibacter urbisdiaboli]
MTKVEKLVQRLESRHPLPLLCPNEAWDADITKQIEQLSIKELTGRDEPSELAALATKSALLLWNDELDKSHTISQGLQQELGSYLHGLMHRREGDFSNAKYWYSFVGDHPMYETLYEKAASISEQVRSWAKWDPYQFIDAVEKVVKRKVEETEEAEQLRRIQVIELTLLLQYCQKA